MGKTCFDGFFMPALRYVIKKMYFCDIEIYLLFIKYQLVMKKFLSFLAVAFAVCNLNAQTATVVLTAGDVWGDGTGYQLLIDADNQRYLENFGPPCGSQYTQWEYTIPENAYASDDAVVINDSQTIQIPAGTYSYLVLNPNCGNSFSENIVASAACDLPEIDDFVFAAGKTYTFSITHLPSDFDCVSISVANTTAISENSVTSVNIFPNPAVGMLNVQSQGFQTIEIVSLLGQVVFSADAESDMQINVSNLTDGVYFVRLNGANGTTTQKFIKK